MTRPTSILDIARLDKLEIDVLAEQDGRFGFVEEGTGYDRLEWAQRLVELFGRERAPVILLMKNAIIDLEAMLASLEQRIADLELKLGNEEVPADQRSVMAIAKAAALAMQIPVSAIRGDGRQLRPVMARQAVVWVARKVTRYSWERIARSLGNRDHSTMVTAHRRAEARRAVDPDFVDLCNQIELAFLSRTAGQ